MKTFLPIVFLLSCFTVRVNAQTITEKNPRPDKVFNTPTGHGIGAVLSSSNGKGLAYRYWHKDLGFHVSFFPAATNTNKYYNGGFTGYLNIREYESGSLFLHLGLEYQYTSRQEYTPNFPTFSYNVRTDGFNLGAGPGFHVKGKFVSMDFFTGYAVYLRNSSSSDPLITPTDNTVVTVTAGISFFVEL